MHLMSDPGPTNPFEGVPFFGDLGRLLGGQGAVPWDAARQIALSLATEGQSEPNVDPLERIKLEELGRVAEMHVAKVTGLMTSSTGGVPTIVPVTRAMWSQRTLDAHRPLLERLAESLGASAQLLDAGDELDDGPEAAMAGWFTQLVQMLNPMMLAMTAGSAIGHLARTNLAQYDLPLPRPSDELLVVVPNLDAFVDEWSVPPDDLRLWVCIHELTHHAVLSVPHVRATLEELLARFVSSFSADPGALERQLGDLSFDPTDPSGMAELQKAMSDPGVLLGALVSPEQQAMRPQLDALISVIVGYVDYVLDTIGTQLIGSYQMLTEALRRRRVATTDADRFVERLFGLELTQATYDRGAAFIAGVVERAGPEGLARLWDDVRFLPTPAEVDAPGLWLARIDLPTDDDIDLPTDDDAAEPDAPDA
jgi:putative hydrolase